MCKKGPDGIVDNDAKQEVDVTLTKPSDCSQKSVLRIVGDIAHMITLSCTLLFAYAVLRHDMKGDMDFFDSEWNKQGFCVTNVDIPYYNSHDLCLYFDTIATIILGIVYYMLSSTPGMENTTTIMKNGIPGVLAHGMGHGMLASAMRDAANEQGEDVNTTLDPTTTTTTEGNIMKYIPLLIFWFGLMKASLPNVSSKIVALGSIISTFVSIVYVPLHLNFTFVQTILLMCFGLNQLSRPTNEKDFSYALYPIIVAFPLTIVGWLESTKCTTFVRDQFYGHLLYDATIPTMMLIWYLICYYNRSTITTTTPAATATKIKTT